MNIPIIEKHITGISFANTFCCALFTTVVLVSLVSKKFDSKEARVFNRFCFCSALAMWSDALSYLCTSEPRLITVMYVHTIVSYAFTFLAACGYYRYIMVYFQERMGVRYHPFYMISSYVYTGICTALYATSFWTHRFFFIDDYGRFQATDYTRFSGYLILPLVISSIVLIISKRKLTTKKDTRIHLLYSLAYIVSGFLDVHFTISLHYIVMTIFVALILIFIGVERDKEFANKEKELAISELNALRLQMNPHFVFNTLASIDGLIAVDPREARRLMAKFTKHLRSSFVDNSPKYIPFEQELENIKCYLSVEEVRFPNIEIEYDIQCSDFEVPPLTVQPIIENAIKHGICKNDDSAGKILISTFADNKNNYIQITDNGIGFDVNAPKSQDGRNHVGIENSQKRLQLICNGSLSVKSKVGEGTTVLITIPKENI